MSKLSKALYLCVIMLLAWLAVMPHWTTIKEEAKNFYTAWQQIRGSNEQAKTEEPIENAEESNIRERSIAAPKPVAELPSPVVKEGEKSLDPFIKEARERALADPEAAMLWLQEQSTGAERLRGMLEVVALWAADDSESALLWLESNAQGLARLETLNSGVELWAERDPKAAAGWIDGMANDQSKISAAKSLATTWVRSNPAEASAWLDTMPNGPVRKEAASALTLSWMETDAASATAWAINEAFNSNDDTIILQTIEKYAKQTPQEAEDFVRRAAVPLRISTVDTDDDGPIIMKTRELTPSYDGEVIARYVDKFVQARAESDPAGTAGWLQSLPENDLLYKTTNATTILKVWAETDSIAASAWLSEQPISQERDAAIVGFSETIQRYEPEAATTWANAISDPTQRAEQLTNSIRTWAKRDPQSALQWVISAELDPKLEEQLGREIGVD